MYWSCLNAFSAHRKISQDVRYDVLCILCRFNDRPDLRSDVPQLPKPPARLTGGPSGGRAKDDAVRDGVRGGPLLLPPRDYDTVLRSHGRLDAVDERRSTNAQVCCTAGANEPSRNSHVRISSQQCHVFIDRLSASSRRPPLHRHHAVTI
jgi:hypothetical protein